MAYDPAQRWTARLRALLAYLVVLAAVAGIVLFALRYQPLPLRTSPPESVAQSDSKMVRVGYENGGTFSFGFLVVNDGPLPVKVQSIQITGQSELLVTVGLETAPKRDAGSLAQGDPSPRQVPSFHLGRERSPVDRGSDALRELRSLRGRRPRDVQRFKVTYSVLGLTKHAWVPLPQGHRGGLASRLRMSVAGRPDGRRPLRSPHAQVQQEHRSGD